MQNQLEATIRKHFRAWVIGSLVIFGIAFLSFPALPGFYGYWSSWGTPKLESISALVSACERSPTVPFRTFLHLEYDVNYTITTKPIRYQSREEVRGIGCESLVGEMIEIEVDSRYPTEPTILSNQIDQWWVYRLLYANRAAQVGSAIWFTFSVGIMYNEFLFFISPLGRKSEPRHEST